MTGEFAALGGAVRFLSCALVACVAASIPGSDASAQPAPPHPVVSTLPGLVPDPARRALEAVGWAPSDLHFDRQDMDVFGGGLYRLPLFDSWIDRPFVVPFDVELFQKTLCDGVGKPSDLCTFAALRLGCGVRRGLISDPVALLEDSLGRTDALREALSRVWRSVPPRVNARERALRPTRWGRPIAEARNPAGKSGDLEAALVSFSSLPQSWRGPIALILAAEASAADWRRMALAGVRPPGTGAQGEAGRSPIQEASPERFLESAALRYVLGLDSETQDPAFLRTVETAAAAVDLGLMQAGASDLLLTLERTIPLLEETMGGRTSGPRRPVRVSTPAGLIVIGTSGPDRYPVADYLLIFDPGGSDDYAAGASGGTLSPVSVLIDLEGDDRYVSGDSTRPAFGSGVTGIGILIDRSGNDRYRGVNVTQGSGLCGIGLLADGAGDDTYDAFTAAQGAGLFGIGILADRNGNDRYHAYQQIQGYGYTLGCGLLVDAEGDDRYLAEDADIRFPSAQSKEHNSTLGQGFGFGKRADYLDGHSLAGGLGFLADGAGNDEYRCGVFGQGAGYWYGVGVLADGAGDDRYQGIWYTQGSAAHFALGVLWEGSGDDSFRSTMNMAQGAGHDFSLGLLYDRAGRDLHDAPNLSLGGGNANGFGIFWDLAGDDDYRVEAETAFGRSNVASRGGLRDRMKNLGLFLDTGGRDRYPESKVFAGNDRLWTQGGTDMGNPLPTETGVGLDTEWKAADR